MGKNITTTSLSESLTLRALRVADAAQLHALELQPAMLHGNPAAPYPTLEKTRAWLEKLDSSKVAIAAVVGDILVGFGILSRGLLRRAHTATISVGVHDAWHGRGVGSALIAEMLDLADHWLGLRRVELNVFTDNHPAIALYRKYGFEVEATFRGAALRDGVLIDCYFMARLREPMPFATDQNNEHEQRED
jgi:L-phenylalanine/L-methionine N-acetyltransferase